MKRLLLLTVLPLAVVSSHGADLAAAAGTAEQKLAAAVAELAALRESIAKEKLPVAAELRQLEATLLEKRRERDRLERISDNVGVELSALETQLKARNDELGYVGNLLNDYANRFNSSLHPAEVSLYAEKIMPVLNVSEQTELARIEKLKTQASALSIGLARIKQNAGGHSFDGRAVLPDGRFQTGKFALLGPIGIFASSDGSVAGLAERGSSTEPRVLVFDPAATPALASFALSGKGEIPLDTTLGRATAIAATRESVLEHIAKGGIWMYPILGFAFVAFAVGLFKFLEISRFKLPPSSLALDILEQLRHGKVAEAERLAKSQEGPASAMLLEGIKHSHLPKELLDEVLFEKLLEVKPKLERGLAIISVTAAVAPLLGLLGTVTGMINTFKLITLFGTGDAKSLSSGISEALITTEFGLIVAIPSLLLSAFLSRKVAGLLSRLEQTSITFVNGVSVIRETRETNGPVAVAS
jgi:biopolymer transport protein ExbB